MIDDVELLEDDKNFRRNMDLTYGVRDGVISHCGEVDEKSITPRSDASDLYSFRKASDFSPYTWEACVVKIADKISYLGRDLEDALMLKILTRDQLSKLVSILKADEKLKDVSLENINNTVLISEFIIDVCKNSSPETGIALSDERAYLMKLIKDFNGRYIYSNYRLEGYKEFASVALNKIFQTLFMAYDREKTSEKIAEFSEIYPFMSSFLHWIEQYWDLDRGKEAARLKNRVIYFVGQNEADYAKAVIDYISGMSDQYLENVYRSIINF